MVCCHAGRGAGIGDFNLKNLHLPHQTAPHRTNPIIYFSSSFSIGIAPLLRSIHTRCGTRTLSPRNCDYHAKKRKNTRPLLNTITTSLVLSPAHHTTPHLPILYLPYRIPYPIRSYIYIRALSLRPSTRSPRPAPCARVRVRNGANRPRACAH